MVPPETPPGSGNALLNTKGWAAAMGGRGPDAFRWPGGSIIRSRRAAAAWTPCVRGIRSEVSTRVARAGRERHSRLQARSRNTRARGPTNRPPSLPHPQSRSNTTCEPAAPARRAPTTRAPPNKSRRAGGSGARRNGSRLGRSLELSARHPGRRLPTSLVSQPQPYLASPASCAATTARRRGHSPFQDAGVPFFRQQPPPAVRAPALQATPKSRRRGGSGELGPSTTVNQRGGYYTHPGVCVMCAPWLSLFEFPRRLQVKGCCIVTTTVAGR